MKKFKILFIAFVMLSACFHSVEAASKDSDDNLVEDIRSSADSFGKAIDVRNYKVAKEQLDLLFPLIKKEMKLEKKKIHELEKNGSEATASKMEKALERKSEINNKLHAYVDVSTAALRVKADDVKLLVEEYVELLDQNNQLLSANK